MFQQPTMFRYKVINNTCQAVAVSIEAYMYRAILNKCKEIIHFFSYPLALWRPSFGHMQFQF